MGINKQLEVELKFEVSPEASAPLLGAVEHVVSVEPEQVHHLSAVYYDTDDLRLSRAKIALRRRTGGKDEGWHIKMPGQGGRVEIQAPLDASTSPDNDQVPEELMGAIRHLVRVKPLQPIARVDNERHEVVGLGVDGEPVAELCDDHVTSWSYLPGGVEKSWREWEVEVTSHAQELGIAEAVLRSARGIIEAAGGRVSDSPSKLVMALGDSVANVKIPEPVATLDKDNPAAAVLAALKRNRDKLLDYDPRVRRDEFDSVHQMRVATRELRSHMQTFEGILTGEKYLSLEEHLKQLAGILGQARDAEVIAARFKELLTLDEASVLDDATRAHLEGDMQRQYELAHRRVVRTLDDPRYWQMLDDLDDILANPPLAEQSVDDADTHDTGTPATGAAAADATDATDAVQPANKAKPAQKRSPEEILLAHLKTAFKKLHARHELATAGLGDSELSLHAKEERFHDIRKAAKKLRYSAEAVGDATSLNTKKLYQACKQMQEVLGDFQDAVTARDKVTHFAEAARRAGEDTFGYGVVYSIEHHQGLEALSRYDDTYEAVTSAYKALIKKAGK